MIWTITALYLKLFFFNILQSFQRLRSWLCIFCAATMSRTVHCHISDLLQLNCIISSSQDLFLSSTASIHAVSLNVVDDSISVNLTYYNSVREQFFNDMMIFCSGALIVSSSSAISQLSIKIHFFIKFVIFDEILFDYFFNHY